MNKQMRSFEEGQALAEYAVTLVLVGVFSIGALVTLGGVISGALSNVNDALTSQETAANSGDASMGEELPEETCQPSNLALTTPPVDFHGTVHMTDSPIAEWLGEGGLKVLAGTSDSPAGTVITFDIQSDRWEEAPPATVQPDGTWSTMIDIKDLRSAVIIRAFVDECEGRSTKYQLTINRGKGPKN